MMYRHTIVLSEAYVRACAEKFEEMDEAGFNRGHHALIGAVADEVPDATRDEVEAGLTRARAVRDARAAYADRRLAA